MIQTLLRPTLFLSLPLLCVTAFALPTTHDNSNKSELFEPIKKQQAQHCPSKEPGVFNRIATFHVCELIAADCDTDTEYSAEIVSADLSGKTLVFTNSPANAIGFVDIEDPSAPKPAGSFALQGEPTSVGTKGDLALVAVNLSSDFINTAGELVVVDIATQQAITSFDLGGQPDSVAISPDKRFAVIAIENERDEDLNDGELPQFPAGNIVVIDITDTDPTNWEPKTVSLTGLAAVAPQDPEPEYVDINEDNIAVVTLQENNHIVLVDLKDLSIESHFSAGTLDLSGIDTEEEEPALISPTQSQFAVPREPDGVTWIDRNHLVTADEGDLNGGSRSFTVFNKQGEVVYSSGNDLDLLSISLGHYPDSRSGNKGNEPENVEFAEFAKSPYLFVASERSSLVFVYDIYAPDYPIFKQALPAATAPEGLLAIPSRNLLIAASEEDSRDDKMRSALNIYQYQNADTAYPNLSSGYRKDGSPIPWSALSGLAAHPKTSKILFAVDDSYFQKNRIFQIKLNKGKGQINKEIFVTDPNGHFASLPAVEVDSAAEEDSEARLSVFDSIDRAQITNEDFTINVDLEGIAATSGGFWLVSEGSGTNGDPSRPINSLNFLIKTDTKGVVRKVVTLPESVNDMQLRFGFEGVAVDGDNVVVAFQRAWADEQNPRLGIYNSKSEQWKFVFYPLDEATSNAGGWVGLSDITALGKNQFMVLERDNQAGPDAAVKRIYQIDLDKIEDGELVKKYLVKDLLPLLKSNPSPVPEKLEGLAILKNGQVYINNDNDGVDDNSGENLLINLGKLK